MWTKIIIFLAGVLCGMGIDTYLNRNYVKWLRDCFFETKEEGKNPLPAKMLQKMWRTRNDEREEGK